MNPMDFLNDEKLTNEEKLRRYFLESGKLPYADREAAQAAAEEQKSGMGIGQALAGLGASMAGRAPGQSLDYFDKRKQAIDEATIGAYDKASKEQSDRVAEYLKNKYAVDVKKEERIAQEEQRRREREEDRKIRRQERIEDKNTTLVNNQNAKAAEDLKKKQEKMFEIEDKRKNILSNLDNAISMIEDKGTYEAFGPHNQKLERIMDEVATDMAKLMDPSSVARPSEVEQVKKNLVSSGFQNSNETAIQLLKDFYGDVNRRADSAYKIRGLESPQQAQPQASKKEVRRQRNKETGEIRVTYDDGSTQIIGGK